MFAIHKCRLLPRNLVPCRCSVSSLDQATGKADHLVALWGLFASVLSPGPVLLPFLSVCAAGGGMQQLLQQEYREDETQRNLASLRLGADM